MPTLRRRFPQVAREELREMQRRYRRVLRRKGRATLHVLRWMEPGAVWAMDHAEAPAPIDDRYGSLLAVRDLASQQQLAALPVEAQDAVTTEAVLESLVREHRAPLVLKADNGSAFLSGTLQSWAKRHRVRLLYSPPGVPSYNGSIEAGIGGLKTRIHHQAARAGRPGRWTADDVAAAMAQGNQERRPWGARGPTPAQVWRARQPIPETARTAFERMYRRHFALECGRRNETWSKERPHYEKAEIDRAALTASLLEGGYLTIRRR